MERPQQIPTVSLTRRKLLAGLAVAGSGGGLVALSSSRNAKAAVTMGDLSIQGDSAELDQPPSEITVSVSGEFEITTDTPPAMTELTLQLHCLESVEDVDTDAVYDATQGSYSLSGDVFDIPDVDADALFPPAGETRTETLLVRVVCAAVDGGEIRAEEHVEREVPLELTHTALTVALGGEGTVEIRA